MTFVSPSLSLQVSVHISQYAGDLLFTQIPHILLYRAPVIQFPSHINYFHSAPKRSRQSRKISLSRVMHVCLRCFKKLPVRGRVKHNQMSISKTSFSPPPQKCNNNKKKKGTYWISHFEEGALTLRLGNWRGCYII